MCICKAMPAGKPLDAEARLILLHAEGRLDMRSVLA